ncbi:MAG: SWIM zinc finger family protein [Saprospiraceae bacterium]|nr:SWIM zinc finger family protein [Saprospiraceae bacterium]
MLFKLETFEDHFDPIILERGYDYYKDGAVGNLDRSMDTWMADVYGSDAYEVNIVVKNGAVVNTDCNCPYDRGPFCKHIAAVLYAITSLEDSDMDIQESPASKTQNPVRKIISQLQEAELRDILFSLASNYEEVHQILLTSYSHLLPIEDAKVYSKKLIKSMVKSAQRGSYGFIDYHACSQLGYDTFQLLTQAPDYGMPAVYLNETVIIEFATAYLKGADDSSGDFGMAIDKAFENLSNCIRHSEGKSDEKEIKLHLFKLAKREFKKEKYQGFDWQLDWIKIAIEAISNAKQAQQLIEAIETSILEYSSKKYSVYTIEALSFCIFKIHKKWSAPEIAADFLDQNLEFDSFRTAAIEIAFENNQDDRVKSLVNEAIQAPKNKSRRGPSHWKEWLLKLAVKNKDIDTQVQLLEEFYLNNYGQGIKYLSQIKECLPEKEFKKKVEFYLDHFRKKGHEDVFNSAVAEIFKLENRLEELLDLLKSHPSFHLLDLYYPILAEPFPEEYAHLYAFCASDEIDQASNRKEYRQICKYLTKMTQIGGLELAINLRQEWMETYKRRPALLDELKKLKW